MCFFSFYEKLSNCLLWCVTKLDGLFALISITETPFGKKTIFKLQNLVFKLEISVLFAGTQIKENKCVLPEKKYYDTGDDPGNFKTEAGGGEVGWQCCTNDCPLPLLRTVNLHKQITFGSK